MCYTKRTFVTFAFGGPLKSGSGRVKAMTEQQIPRRPHVSNNEANRITREAIQTALLLLMEEKEFKKISITELVSRAGVSRQSFYRNYNSKEDIVIEIENAIVTSFENSMDAPQYKGNLTLWFRDLFTIFSEKKNEMYTLYKAGMLNMALTRIPRLIEDRFSEGGVDNHYVVLGIVGAVCSIGTEWFASGMNDEPDEMARICTDFVMHHVPQGI